jgi:uncharacterized protein Usg
MDASRDFALAVAGYGLTTAQIFYRFPDFPGLIQTYIWQEYDLPPDFPKLFAFLDYWKIQMDGKLHSVNFNHSPSLMAREWRIVGREIRLE